jgi:hypothetical protein
MEKGTPRRGLGTPAIPNELQLFSGTSVDG